MCLSSQPAHSLSVLFRFEKGEYSQVAVVNESNLSSMVSFVFNSVLWSHLKPGSPSFILSFSGDTGSTTQHHPLFKLSRALPLSA